MTTLSTPTLRHSLSQKDETAKTAVCAICGPVKMAWNGRLWRCGEAQRQRMARLRSENAEHYREYHREYQRTYRKTEYQRTQRPHWRRKQAYGITQEQFEEMLTRQGGVCAICQGEMDPPNVDHNHTTGVVRGLLCSPCNKGLGHFGDDAARIARAIDYLGGQ